MANVTKKRYSKVTTASVNTVNAKVNKVNTELTNQLNHYHLVWQHNEKLYENV